MDTELIDIPTFLLHTTAEDIDRFTSLLQAGILIPAVRGVSIGAFLESLPGFTADYITDQVQTIFLNGTATDDMETPMEGDNPVLAISAAMPGLAGAIFRRNSLHAALRTVKATIANNSATDEITVTLVITSYSIHYTKLYDPWRSSCLSWQQRPFWRSKGPSLSVTSR